MRLWLEGKEPVAISQQIKHSIKAVENYLQKFKRVAFLKGKGFNEFEIALSVGISVYATNIFSLLCEEFKDKAFFEQRLEEINMIGMQYYEAQDEKKRTLSPNGFTTNVRRQ